MFNKEFYIKVFLVSRNLFQHNKPNSSKQGLRVNATPEYVILSGELCERAEGSFYDYFVH